MSSNSASEPQKLPWSLLRAGGRHGLSDSEKRDPIGLAVAALNKLASSDLLDRLGIRKASEQTRLPGHQRRLPHRRQRRPHLRPGRQGHPGQPGPRREEHRPVRPHPGRGRADARRRGRRVRRGDGAPGRRRGQRGVRAPPTTCSRPPSRSACRSSGVPEELGGIATERSAMAGTLVHEALAKGDMGLAVAALAPGAVATALSLWGTDEQQSTYLPGVHRRRGPRCRPRARRADRRSSTRSPRRPRPRSRATATS